MEKIVNIASSAYLTYPAGVDPYVFTFEGGGSGELHLQQCRTPKLKHTCDHVLSSGTYTLGSCPRCLGNGVYYDIDFTSLGIIEQVFDENKLEQELEKNTLTPFGENLYHPRIGTLLSHSLGKALTQEERESVLKQSLIDMVYRLKATQRRLILNNEQEFSPYELIESIENIEVFSVKNEPRKIEYRVHILTVSGTTSVIGGTIII